MTVIKKVQKNLKLGNRLQKMFAIAKEESGTTLVEFAFSSIVLLGITFGMVDFGSILYARNAVQSAAQEGAREGIMVEDDGSLRYSDIEEAVKDKLLLLDPGKADITVNKTGGDTVEVRVEYPVEFITPVGNIISLLGSGNGDWAKGWTIKAEARMVIR